MGSEIISGTTARRFIEYQPPGLPRTALKHLFIFGGTLAQSCRNLMGGPDLEVIGSPVVLDNFVQTQGGGGGSFVLPVTVGASATVIVAARSFASGANAANRFPIVGTSPNQNFGLFQNSATTLRLNAYYKKPADTLPTAQLKDNTVDTFARWRMAAAMLSPTALYCADLTGDGGGLNADGFNPLVLNPATVGDRVSPSGPLFFGGSPTGTNKGAGELAMVAVYDDVTEQSVWGWHYAHFSSVYQQLGMPM